MSKIQHSSNTLSFGSLPRWIVMITDVFIAFLALAYSIRFAEIYAQAKNETSTTQFVTTRFGNVLGFSGSVIPLFKKRIKQGGPLTVTDINVTRYFMTIPEAC